MTSPPETHHGRRWAIRLLKAAVAVLALLATWRFFTHANIRWGALEAQVVASDPGFLALGVVFLLGRFALWDWRFRLACRRTIGESSGVLLGFFVLLASAALNLITPTARVIGGLMRARYFARSSGRTFGRLYGAVLYDQLAHHTVLIACTWVAVIVMAFEVGKDRLGIAGAVALAVAAAALYLWSRRGGAGGSNPIVRFLARRAEQSDGRMQQLYAHGHEAVEVFGELLAGRRLRWQSAALGVAYFLVQGLAQYWIFLAMGARLPLTVVIAGVAVGNAAGTLSGTPGGAGTTELAMVPSFVAMGLTPELAMAGTLLFRGLHYLVVLAVGLPALAILELGAGKQPLLEEEAP